MTRILYIHSEKKQRYGAHYINELIVQKLRKEKYSVDVIYPKESINFMSSDMQGISDILFYYSLINAYKQSERYDIIQGTTYTPLAFVKNGNKVISHFGSTSWGFLKSVPSLKKLEIENKNLVSLFKSMNVCNVTTSIKNLTKSLKDISKVEIYVAKNSDLVIATSKKVEEELIKNKVPKNKISILHNAIEDYWFDSQTNKRIKKTANLVYIGRMGDDPFTVKLKGIDRLLFVMENFPLLHKVIIGMCSNVAGYENRFKQIINTKTHLSTEKNKIPHILKNHFGDIYINPSRYEGFCLSLIESMSQGLVPIVFPFGVAPEVIQNGKNGYIVNNIEEMIKKINFLKNRVAIRKKIAMNAIKTSKLFTSEIMIEKYKKKYKTLLSQK